MTARRAAKPKPPAAPAGLGKAGRALWSRLTAPWPDGRPVAFERHELVLVEAACRQADLNADLEAVLARDGLVVKGSTGQTRLNAALAELRNGRLAVQRLLAGVSWPSDDGGGVSAASERARAAAQSRWSGHVRRADA